MSNLHPNPSNDRSPGNKGFRRKEEYCIISEVYHVCDHAPKFMVKPNGQKILCSDNAFTIYDLYDFVEVLYVCVFSFFKVVFNDDVFMKKKNKKNGL